VAVTCSPGTVIVCSTAGSHRVGHDRGQGCGCRRGARPGALAADRRRPGATRPGSETRSAGSTDPGWSDPTPVKARKDTVERAPDTDSPHAPTHPSNRPGARSTPATRPPAGQPARITVRSLRSRAVSAIVRASWHRSALDRRTRRSSGHQLARHVGHRLPAACSTREQQPGPPPQSSSSAHPPRTSTASARRGPAPPRWLTAVLYPPAEHRRALAVDRMHVMRRSSRLDADPDPFRAATGVRPPAASTPAHGRPPAAPYQRQDADLNQQPERPATT